jgi:ribose 5-phosphate isomerase B
MKIYNNVVISSDHNGYLLKNAIIQYLQTRNLSVKDLGPDNQERVDYPDYAKKVVDKILEGTSIFGILICDTGIGMSIAANRSSGIRAALCANVFMAERARLHNDANILVLGTKLVSETIAFEVVDKFIGTKFEGGRHSIRLSKLH